MKRWIYAALVIIILICLLPLFGILWSSWFAQTHGCTLNEANSYPCVVNGKDWGPTLGAAFLSGWLGLLTFPIAGIAALVLLVMGVRDAIRRKRSKG